MDLKKYLETRNKKQFARDLGISIASLVNYYKGKRLVPLDIAHKIEAKSEGRVSTEDLEKIWRDKHERH